LCKQNRDSTAFEGRGGCICLGKAIRLLSVALAEPSGSPWGIWLPDRSYGFIKERLLRFHGVPAVPLSAVKCRGLIEVGVTCTANRRGFIEGKPTSHEWSTATIIVTKTLGIAAEYSYAAAPLKHHHAPSERVRRNASA